MSSIAKTAKKQGHGFQKGVSGNPAGRPKGARNKTTLAVEALLNGDATKLTRFAIQRALDGDTAALRLCLERICPPAKERAVQFELPPLESADDLPDATAAIIQAVATGDLALSEGESLLRMLDSYRRAEESADFEHRLQMLEAALVEGR